jgi:hypothetical protein
MTNEDINLTRLHAEDKIVQEIRKIHQDSSAIESQLINRVLDNQNDLQMNLYRDFLINYWPAPDKSASRDIGLFKGCSILSGIKENRGIKLCKTKFDQVFDNYMTYRKKSKTGTGSVFADCLLSAEFVNGGRKNSRTFFFQKKKPTQNSNQNGSSPQGYNIRRALEYALAGEEDRNILEKASLWRLLVGKVYAKRQQKPEIWLYTDGTDIKGCARSEGSQRFIDLSNPFSKEIISDLPSKYKRFGPHILFSQILSNKAESELEKRKIKSAIQFSEIAKWVTPSYWDSYRIKGEAYAHSDPKRAITELSEAIKRHTGDWKCYMKRGDLFMQQKEYINASNDFKKVQTHCLEDTRMNEEAAEKYKVAKALKTK